jgi:hypothetical protein
MLLGEGGVDDPASFVGLLPRQQINRLMGLIDRHRGYRLVKRFRLDDLEPRSGLPGELVLFPGECQHPTPTITIHRSVPPPRGAVMATIHGLVPAILRYMVFSLLAFFAVTAFNLFRVLKVKPSHFRVPFSCPTVRVGVLE